MKKKCLVFTSVLFLSITGGAQKLLENNNIHKTTVKDFPAPATHQQQIVIQLPAKATPEEERNYKVEIIPGKKMKVDCNRHGLNGSIEEKTVQSMGINFYEFKTTGDVWSTRMGCPDNSDHEEFVTAKGLLVDYNSQTPLVVYMPNGYEVRYRVWSAGEIMVPSVKEIKNTSETLYGEWEWVSSKGGYTGGETALKNTGMSNIYSFKKDGYYTQYKNGKMVPARKFKLSNGASIFKNGKLPMIELSGNDRKMSYSFNGCDTLILSEECYDCYTHTYRRKK